MTIFYDLFRNEPRLVKLTAGTPLFRQGDAADGLMYVLVAGHADVLVGERLVEQSRAGAIMGELAMIEDAPRTATVIARSDCEFATIDHKRFRWLVSETPGFAVEVMRVMAHRLRHCDELLEGGE